MRALTLTAPWGTLVMLGAKRVETRPVLFSYRGSLAIHQSRILDGNAWEDPIFRQVLSAHGIERPDQIPLGKVLGELDVVDGCRFTADAFPGCLPRDWIGRIGEHEEHFGNYRAGRGGLLLDNRRPYAEPIPQRGMNGLWPWDPPPGLPFAGGVA